MVPEICQHLWSKCDWAGDDMELFGLILCENPGIAMGLMWHKMSEVLNCENGLPFIYQPTELEKLSPWRNSPVLVSLQAFGNEIHYSVLENKNHVVLVYNLKISLCVWDFSSLIKLSSTLVFELQESISRHIILLIFPTRVDLLNELDLHSYWFNSWFNCWD